MSHRPFRVDPHLRALAQTMRRTPAPAEQVLWYRLRNRRLNGFKFRRQVGIDRYIADFYCAEVRLILELDGESHTERADYDARRTRDLSEAGYRVVRFSNVEVFENLDGVLLAILQECEQLRNSTSGPSPQPSPLSTGERE